MNPTNPSDATRTHQDGPRTLPDTQSATMSPEAQRIAIAEVCGWSQIENGNTMAIGGMWNGYPPSCPVIGQKRPLPLYLSDLNAMHEAEKVLNGGQWETYGRWLAELNNINFPLHGGYVFQVAHATAAQRAEAFLRTLGKWETSS